MRDEVGHKQIDWDGGANAKGYYISNGGVQEIRWSKDENNEESYLRFYDLNGNEIKINRGKSGANAKGYYISNGGVQEIRWSKDENNEESYLRFYDLNGNEIKINRGKSYIALNYANKTTMK